MKRQVPKSIKQSLSKPHACYVLITCDEPTDDGCMQVEMTYEGDANVAAYLLEGAQYYMHEEKEKPTKVSHQDKIHHFKF